MPFGELMNLNVQAIVAAAIKQAWDLDLFGYINHFDWSSPSVAWCFRMVMQYPMHHRSRELKRSTAIVLLEAVQLRIRRDLDIAMQDW